MPAAALHRRPHRPSAAWTAAVLSIICCVASSQNLDSLIDLAQLLASDPPRTTVENINIIQRGDDDGGGSVPICHMPYLFPFTGRNGEVDNTRRQYEGLAAIALAMEHLNTGNGSIVPEVEGIDARCPMRFTTQSYDTKAQQSVGVEHMVALTDRRNLEHLLPCAILGASESG